MILCQPHFTCPHNFLFCEKILSSHTSVVWLLWHRAAIAYGVCPSGDESSTTFPCSCVWLPHAAVRRNTCTHQCDEPGHQLGAKSGRISDAFLKSSLNSPPSAIFVPLKNARPLVYGCCLQLPLTSRKQEVMASKHNLHAAENMNLHVWFFIFMTVTCQFQSTDSHVDLFFRAMQIKCSPSTFGSCSERRAQETLTNGSQRLPVTIMSVPSTPPLKKAIRWGYFGDLVECLWFPCLSS